MTLLVLLLLGLGFILVVSGLETDPSGGNVPVVQTIQDVWHDKLQGPMFNPAPSSNNPPPSETIPPGMK